MKRLFLGLTGIITLILASATPAFASTNDFRFESFDADYYLTKNLITNQGDLKIEETLVAVFPSYDQNHGIDRCIPSSYKDTGRIDILSVVVFQDGLPASFSARNTSDGFYCLRIGDANTYVHGKVTYQIAYGYKNVIVRFTDQTYQEFYWDTNGTSWSQPFGSLTARLHLSQELYDSLEKSTKTSSAFSCYVGYYGESGQDRCSIAEYADDNDGRLITFAATNLHAGENLTMNAMFKNNTFAAIETKPVVFVDNYLFFFLLGGEILLIGIILAIILTKRKKYSDKIALAKDKSVPVQYTPIKGISVAEMAENYLKATRGSTNVATLIELATSHKIALEKGEKKVFGGYKWKVHVKDLTDVTREQEIVLEILKGGSSVKAGDVIDVKSRSSTATLRLLAQSFQEKVIEALKDKGLFESTAKSTKEANAVVVIAITIIFLVFPFLFTIVPLAFLTDTATSVTKNGEIVNYVGASYLVPTIFIIFIASIVILPLIAGSNSKYKKRTLEGIKTSKYLDGLKEYMELAEADRLKFLQSVEGADTTHGGIVKLYEKLLPYAIIFGIEDSWMEELNKYYQFDDVSNPDWVTAGVLLSASDFRSFNTYTSSAISSSTMSESSGSSGGFSGGGGGGFSGGGGGGGGGGGW